VIRRAINDSATYKEKNQSIQDTYRVFELLDDIVSPTELKTLQYDEKTILQKMETCLSITTFEDLDIIKYINGEEITDEEGEVIEPSVSDKTAKDRLFFLVGESIDKLQPACSTLQILKQNILSTIFLECPLSADRLKDAIIKLNFTTGVYHVRLSELIYALYNTKKQVFVLLPSGENSKKLSSLNYRLEGAMSAVSGAHCQEGTQVKLYSIHICTGDNCFPENNIIESPPPKLIITENKKISLLKKYFNSELKLDSLLASEYEYESMNVEISTVIKQFVSRLYPFTTDVLDYDKLEYPFSEFKNYNRKIICIYNIVCNLFNKMVDKVVIHKEEKPTSEEILSILKDIDTIYSEDISESDIENYETKYSDFVCGTDPTTNVYNNIRQ
jgi:hypothetical protein